MFDWNAYLTVSHYLLKLGDRIGTLDEAFYRCAISRAYYYIYHKAHRVAKDNGFKRDPSYKGGPHEEVINFLNSINKSTASINLQRLKKNRISSDYFENRQIKKQILEASMLLVATIESNL